MMVVVGSYARDRVDLGGKTLSEAPLSNLVASRDNQSVPEGDYFHEISRLLQDEYVEPIKDENKLAIGAVRGMVGSLGDPKSMFMDKDEFAAFLHRREGIYEGIGVDLELVMPAAAGAPKQTSTFVGEDGEPVTPSEDLANGVPRIPRVTVVAVVPGGPADRAGVKPGDVVYTVDDRWVWNGDLIVRFRKAQKDWMAKKIDLATLNKMRSEVREKTERDLLPHKARQRLMVGKSGNVKVVWTRAGAHRTTNLTRAESRMPGLSTDNGKLRLNFVAGASDWLKENVEGKPAVTIDLTNNPLGDFGEMNKCLAAIAPTGQYGALVSKRSEKPIPFQVTNGNKKPPKVTLLVDGTTRGAAAIFASALKSKGAAQVQGQLSQTEKAVYDIVQLPDGSGYTLVTREYKPVADTRSVRRGS
jgi:carboxyl-terminal processing protease